MTHEIIMAGHGGQGVLFMGTLLARAGMLEGKEVSWLPSYGAEQRGGTANCAVVVADTQVVSPMVTEATGMIILNQPSLDKFLLRLLPGGVLILNNTLATGKVEREDLRIISLPANRLAAEAGDERIGNMVALGALVAATGVVTLESLVAAMGNATSSRWQHLLGFNRAALQAGADWAAGAGVE